METMEISKIADNVFRFVPFRNTNQKHEEIFAFCSDRLITVIDFEEHKIIGNFVL